MHKILTSEQIKKGIPQAKKITLVGGCFDVLHPGHIEFLKKAKELGEILIVLLESDATVVKLKGNKRPIFNQAERATLLSSLEMVDFVILLSPHMTDSDYTELVKLIKPDIIAVTSPDRLEGVKRKQAELVGGTVISVMERNTKYSTTKLVSSLLQK